jgi:O-6-methylguanine DNA methyltransferase
METLHFATLPSPYGDLWALRTPKGLAQLLVPKRTGRRRMPGPLLLFNWRDTWSPGGRLVEEPERLADVSAWLRAYFAGEVPRERIPLDLHGTPFQTAVWSQIQKIPYGHSSSYGEIARRIGRRAGSARAVGTAVGSNPVWVIVPCHRVVGEDGSLTGYGGGLRMKESLLRLEGHLLI